MIGSRQLLVKRQVRISKKEYISNIYSIFCMKSSLVQISKKDYMKQTFIMNALENGWNVKKRNESYIFTKKHENKKEIFQENYLEEFIQKSIST